MEIWQYVFIFTLGIVCGVINVLAGGGSNLTIPVLMMYGLPADIANATNRVGIMLQNVAGVSAFMRAKQLPTHDLKAIILPTCYGGIVGAIFASYIPEPILKYLLLAAMLTMSGIMLFAPHIAIAVDEKPRLVADTPLAKISLFIAGLYGSFVQAGVGFILIAAIVGNLRYSMAAANALKLLCTLFFTGIALILFIWRGQIMWQLGLVLAGGNMIGALIGVRLNLGIKPKTMRFLLFAMTLVAVISVFIKR